MSLIDAVFTDLRAKNQTALMPFITAGDPDLDFTSELLHVLAECGAHLFEVGVPYSDPIADGPVIQASYTRALAKGVRVDEILKTLADVTQAITPPVVTMVSYAIIGRRGLQEYVDVAMESGIAGAIVPDLPVEEAAELAKICAAADFSLIQLVAPTTPRDRALRIAETSSGFLYYVSVTGITGERASLPAELTDNVAWLRERTPLPICIGFGISGAAQVRELAPYADGLIVGSAIVKKIAHMENRPRADVLAEVSSFVSELVAELT